MHLTFHGSKYILFNVTSFSAKISRKYIWEIGLLSIVDRRV